VTYRGAEPRLTSREAGRGLRTGRGHYYEQLKRYFDAFDRNQIKVYLYEELSDVPIDTLRDTFRFLGVDDSFVPDVSLGVTYPAFPGTRP
jgi:hypothetical protein